MEERAGWRTTEFWMQAIPMVGVFLLLGTGRIDVDGVARLWPILASMHGGSGLYALGRSIVKRGYR